MDYSFFGSHWLQSDCNEVNGYCEGTDFDESGVVDRGDLQALCGYWLEGM